MVAKKEAEVAVRQDFSHVNSWDDAFAHFGSQVTNAAEAFGDGSVLVKDKMELVGKKFFILDWTYNKAGRGNQVYVNVLAIAENGNRFRFNDGSTGIRDQLMKYEDETGQRGGIMCSNGLRASEYEHPEHGPSITFYISS